MAKEAPKTVKFHYIKNQTFHSLHADGAIGGVTPSGNIHIAFYNERMPIPTEIVQKLDEKGALGEIESKTTREAVVREMEVDVVMNIDVAKNLHKWLGVQIEEHGNIGHKEPK